jgi:hypothetical protein
MQGSRDRLIVGMSFAHLADVRLNRGPRSAFDQRHAVISFREGIPMKSTLPIAMLLALAPLGKAIAGGTVTDAPTQVESRVLVFVCAKVFEVRVNPVTQVSEFGRWPYAFRSRNAGIGEHSITVRADNGGTMRIDRDANTFVMWNREREQTASGTCTQMP